MFIKNILFGVLLLTLTPFSTKHYSQTSGWINLNNNSTEVIRLNDDHFTGIEEWIAGGDDKNISPGAFSLYQNYPNPFNNSTVISYLLLKTSFISLKVYDVLGNKVATLINEEKPVGKFEVVFTGSNRTSGIYFYRLTAENFIDTKKMILIK